MKTLYKSIYLLLSISLTHAGVFSQTIKPNVISSGGGILASGNLSLSFTIGEPLTTTLINSNLMLTQGFQQPYISVSLVNLRALIQGYYLGNGFMQSVISPNTSSTLCDTVMLGIANTLAPYDVVAVDTAVINTSGQATFRFPASHSGKSYYLVVYHRNSLETWSASPVLLNDNVSYDFTLNPGMTYGENVIETFDNQGWAIYSGDVAGGKDGLINHADFISVQGTTPSMTAGYQLNDLTGDGMIESSDYSLIENNAVQNISLQKP